MEKIEKEGARAFPLLAGLIFMLAATLGVCRGGAEAAIGLVGAMLLYVAASLAEGRFLKPQRGILLFCGAFLGSIALLDFQAAFPVFSAHDTLQLASILLPLALLSSPALLARLAALKIWRFWPWILVGGLLAAACAMGFLRLAGNEGLLTKYNRGASYGFLFAWPAAAMLWRERRQKDGGRRFVFFLIAILPALFLTHSRAAQTGLCFGLLMAAFAACAPVWAPRLGGIIALLSVLWPFGAQAFFRDAPDLVAKLPDSWRARVEIWDYLSYRVLEKPFLGWGIGCSYKLPFAEPDGSRYIFTTFPAAHPHNMFVQLWVELGIPGALFGLAMLFLSLRAMARLSADLRAFAFGAWAYALVLLLSAYDFWTDSLICSLALCAALFAVLRLQKLEN
jgi:O-antigen ligase